MLPAVRALPVYPVVLAFTFVLAAFLDADVSIHAAARSFAIVIVAASLLTGLLVAGLAPVRGSILAAVFVLVGRSGNLTHAAVAVVLVLLVAAAFFLVRRTRPETESLRQPVGVLNAISLLLLAVTVLNGAAQGALGRIGLQQGAPPESLPAGTRDGPPDIYVILLDGYPRADTTQRLFGFDNAAFLAGLEGLGFEVADAASSNYMYTALTLASMHHMEYVDRIPNLNPVRVPYGDSLRGAINRNPTWDVVRDHGYRVAAVKAPWENEVMRAADAFCGTSTNDFEMFLVKTTLIGAAVQAVDPAFEADQHRATVHEAFDCLGQLSEPTMAPKLVFAHVGSPHLPIVFDADGEAADPAAFGHTRQELTLGDDAFAEAYVAQLEYLNKRVLAAAAELSGRDDQPVVIILSDHGSESRLDWSDASRSDMAERFGILFAARTPGHEGLFDCDVTPIQVFPALLQAYLGEETAAPAARHYISPTNAKLQVQEIADPAPGAECGT